MPEINAFLTKLLKSRLVTAVQWVVVLIFTPILGFLLFGSADRDNLANLLIWSTWWPVLCLLFIFAARLWCALCPFSFVSGWVQRLTCVGLSPPEFLKRHGGWLIVIAFFFLSWMEETNVVMNSPRKSAAVLLSILSGAIIFGMFFRGRVWCRYVCPLGSLSQVYARISLFKLRSNEAACADCVTKDCVVPDVDYAGCPMHLTPFAIDSVGNCSCCGACIRRCKNESLRVAFEAPSNDLSCQSLPPSSVPWMLVLLSGFICFLNAMHSPLLPDAVLLLHATHPVFVTTAMMAVPMLLACFLFVGCLRLAGGSLGTVPERQLLQLGSLSIIPLVLFSHFGYLSEKIREDGYLLLDKLAGAIGSEWLAESISGALWTPYFNPFCVVIGLALTLALLRFGLARMPKMPVRRTFIWFTVFYLLFAAGNLLLIWPSEKERHQQAATRTSTIAGEQDGWKILWPFLGLNLALLALAQISRRADQESGADKQVDFSASRSWVIPDRACRQQTEILPWLLEQAIQGQWRIPSVVGLANATSEIITFLQRRLPESAAITVNATLRKNKGVMTIYHEGRPLSLPDYKAVTSLDDIDDAAMDGLELRLAGAQVEHMGYQARINEARCSFTLRQTCQ